MMSQIGELIEVVHVVLRESELPRREEDFPPGLASPQVDAVIPFATFCEAGDVGAYPS
jgi:hypothetical protein